MANIHINRDRRSLGQFTPEDVAAGLQSGRLLANDLAWTEGMESWKPLSEFPGLPEVERAQGIAPLTPEGAEGKLPAVPSSVEPAWERRKEGELISSVGESLKDLIISPGKVFSALPPNGGIGNPLVFMVLVAGGFWGIFFLYNLLFSLVAPLSLGQPISGSLVFGFVFWMCVIPIANALFAFIFAAIFHGLLLLLGGAQKPFATTFSVVCYSHSAAALLLLIPLCGLYIYPIYNIVLCVIGLQKAHQTETWRTTLAVLFPMLLCCGGMLAAGLAAYESLNGTEFWQQVMDEVAKQRL